MSREIKFKARLKETNEIFPVLTIWSDSICLDFTESEHDYDSKVISRNDVVLLQYAELTDNKGQEIYDEDILKVIEVSENKILEYLSPVEYLESGFIVTEPDGTHVPLACFHPITIYPLFEIEVIGNKFKNSELLEVLDERQGKEEGRKQQ